LRKDKESKGQSTREKEKRTMRPRFLVTLVIFSMVVFVNFITWFTTVGLYLILK
jgi:cell division protein FtsB